MSADRIALIICGGIGLAVIIPLLIYASLRRQNTSQQIELLKRAAARSRQPWINEDKGLEELSRLVSNLQEKPPESSAQNKNKP